MQKYLVVEIQTTSEGYIGAPVNAYETEEDALAKYYTVLAGAAKSNVPVHSCVILTSDGFTLKSECFVHNNQVVPEE